MKVHARVDFPAGLLTEFYPPIAHIAPLVSADEKAGKALPVVGGGMLDWGELLLTPADVADTAFIPTVSEGDRYAAARQTDSDVVQTTDAKGIVSQEKFLFYRGICNIQLPLKLHAMGNDRFELLNPHKTSIAAAYLVQINGGKVRFQRFEKFSGPMGLNLPQSQSSLNALAASMTRDLASSGLYEKEAKAMVQTWQSSWFGEEGTRLLYILPANMADQALPLTITPKPQLSVRVMVGRLEIMTPERESDITRRLAGDAPVSDLGRFAEPVLHRVLAVSRDATVKARAQAMLKKLSVN
jgi:hypothetical protein